MYDSAFLRNEAQAEPERNVAGKHYLCKIF